jgi:hypothetical protein
MCPISIVDYMPIDVFELVFCESRRACIVLGSCTADQEAGTCWLRTMIVAGSLIDPGGRCPAHARPHSVGLVAPGQTEVHDEPKSEVSVAG